jgi:Zn-finger protein
MINLLPQCTKCGSPVTDTIESEVEQHGKIKSGNYINGVWICDDCLGAEKKEEKEYSTSQLKDHATIRKHKALTLSVVETND